MKRVMVMAALGVAVMASGCATKRYPIATAWSQAEAEVMDCNQLRLEMIRARQVETQIAETADFDWRSVAGFLGDYGIGNAMAKSDADRAIRQRIAGIQEAQREKNCPATVSWLDSLEGLVGRVIGQG
ncbi:hypothetical protein [Brevundimonas balnearis]|uniref:Lipoprotein n=1 Tax=Brevundimonas balnearis TaxID=1572858 RepID=A0ABV6R0W4_9CAUL